MMFMKGRKKKLYGKPRLALKVSVLEVKEVDLFRDFECHPVCLVATNSFKSMRAGKLRWQGSKWDEELKIKLPRKPTSEWVRIIIYDELPPTCGNAQQVDSGEYGSAEAIRSSGGSCGGNSSQEYNPNSGNEAKFPKQRRYLYVGETKVSVLDLFKDHNESGGAEFIIPPTSYKIYDKRRHTSGKTDESCGQVELGFHLVTLHKQDNLGQAYYQWKNSLSANHMYQMTLKKSNFTCTGGGKQPGSSEVEKYSANTKCLEDDEDEEEEDEEGYDSYLDYSDEDAVAEAGEAVDSDSDYELLAAFQSHDIDDEPFVNDGVALSSMVSAALDEYEVVRPEEASVLPSISTLGFENHGMAGSAGSEVLEDDPEEVSDTAEEYSEDEDDNTADITVRKSRNRLTSLRKKKSYDRKFKKIYLSNWANYKLSKRQHAAGIVFMEIESIQDLPRYKTKVSRRKYDMDPFVIAAFGRRVFKTSWRKHTLNPIFKERAAFEVFPEETRFGFHFNVMDKDAFSYNNKVAHCHLSWSEMMSSQHGEDEDWGTLELPLVITKVNMRHHSPKLLVKMRFLPYASLKKFFWKNAVNMGTNLEEFDIAQLSFYLDEIGSFTTEEVCAFFRHFKRSPWSGECITKDELIEYLQTWNQSSGFKNVWKCPSCGESCKPTRNTMKSKLVIENDLITHFAVCSYGRKYKLLKPSYVSSDFASKRWYSKILIKLTYGKYALGSNNANILVQDRETGIILEEKISAHVKLGMRIIYNGKGKQAKNFKQLLKTLSLRQGKKFDDPSSVRQIESFVKYHSLNVSECQEMEYKTFNEFFYRKLKPGTRVPEGDSSEIFLSPADSRCTVFATVHQSKEIWIKGSSFTLPRLTRRYHPEIFNDSLCSVAIFRLAPQDYHRFHSPCNGTIGKAMRIDGEYYTVNPMAVRSSLDVFCENIRAIIPIESPEFGTLLCIPVGAMMVGSIMLTCKEGDTVVRGQELGYFKFGGSTVIIVIPSDKILFDPDLSKNSVDGIETLVKVGMSVGHTPDSTEFKRERLKLEDPEQIESVKRKISIGHENADVLGRLSWQYRALEQFITKEYGKPEIITDETADSAQ